MHGLVFQHHSGTDRWCCSAEEAKFLRHVCVRCSHVGSGCLDPSSPARIPGEGPASPPDLTFLIIIFIIMFSVKQLMCTETSVLKALF
ncbi:hypothetical protein AMECASPLE_039758 [Ameca splendens]|uniref:Uncharacterized protein n=1 Tax=Ameca splendens TaxID=208324 RepID=A0ABV0ZVG8_9TELE